MQLHVDQRRAQIFDRRKPLVEGLGGLDLVDQRLGHWRLGLVVPRKLVEHFARQQPILVHLAWIFDEVAWRPRQPRIKSIRHQRMDAVAEFVKQGLGIVEADQHRLAGARLGEIIVVGREHQLVAEQARTTAVGCGPRARTLSVAGIIVHVKQSGHVARLAVAHFERPHVGVEHGDRAGIFLEVETVKLACCPEHAIDHV